MEAALVDAACDAAEAPLDDEEAYDAEEDL